MNESFKESLKDARHLARKALSRSGLVDPFKKPFESIEFETTAHCNRSCSYCPVSMYPRNGDLDGTYMKPEVFQKLLQDLKEMKFEGEIAPHMYGEPLTDPRIVSWVKEIRTELPNAKIKLVTNGDYLTEEIYFDLIDAGLDYFNLSKHGAQLSDSSVALLQKLTPEEKKKRFNILDFYEDFKNDQTMFNTRGGEVQLTDKAKSKKRNPIMCSYVVYPVLNTFGDVVLCCNDYNSEHKFGNIMKRSLKEIWEDPKNIEIRRRIYKGYFDYQLCKNCYM